MREEVVRKLKAEIHGLLQDYLDEQNAAAAEDRRIDLESISEGRINDPLLCEIRIVLSVIARPCECGALIEGIYEALRPHCLCEREVRMLLMSLHTEVCRITRRRFAKRATIRYLFEGTPGEDANREFAASAELPV